ncbi:phosphate regulon sensor histidine kinase PhoR [Aliidiomarina soli]|uniref:Phosphate regulon sensor protein PhoR n=1 Tax=Aliidiomarina soli TaxID=1928574 RepID=A0A432WEG8_9GAMM|nr:phosphate regulon sensor histidine kinase PhoR [Aliidiomarina soli]RUO31220.1 two-component system sensor histidine kinase PhoR [Aliidiomarina soli]
MGRNYTLSAILRGLLVYLLPFVLAGWYLDVVWQALALALLLKLCWHYYYINRLTGWLWDSRTLLPPMGKGVWTDIFDGIYRTLRRNQVRQRSLSTLIKRFRQASEAMPDAAVVLKEDGTVTWANKLAQLYFGLQWPGDNGIRITNLIRHPRFVKFFKKGDFSQAVTMHSPAHASMEVEVRVMPYADNQFLLIARDVTQLTKLERMRKDFVANVSHELKTPLTVMQGYLEMLDEPELLPAKQLHKAIHDMTAQTARMQNMVNQLLELSRIESSGPDSFTEEVDMAALIRSCVHDVSLLNSEKQHRIEVSLDEHLSVYGSADKLRAVVMNLLTNAIKYSPAGGTINLTWQRRHLAAAFSISDTGPGIEPEHLSRLTERFYRIDADRNSATGGTGLGLSIVKHALEHHRSRLQIDSKVGQGSRFSFVVPAELIVQAKADAT